MILFQDADGCLNTPDGSPIGFTENELSIAHKASLAELGKLIDQSPVEHYVMNTGRSWDATKYLCQHIGSAKLRYALVEHGCELWDVQANTEVDLHATSRTHNLHHVTKALETAHRVKNLMRWFTDQGSKALANAVGYAGSINLAFEKRFNLTFSVPEALDGEHLMATLKQLIESESEFSHDGFVYHHAASDRFIDVMGSMNKGMGVETIVAMLGGQMSHTAAVGDGLNDMPMLELVARPVCPANARSEVKQHCEQKGHHSEDAYIDGVMSWLRLGSTSS